MTCLGGGPAGVLATKAGGLAAGVPSGSAGGAFLGIGRGRALLMACGCVLFVLNFGLGVPIETAGGGTETVLGCGGTSVWIYPSSAT